MLSACPHTPTVPGKGALCPPSSDKDGSTFDLNETEMAGVERFLAGLEAADAVEPVAEDGSQADSTGPANGFQLPSQPTRSLSTADLLNTLGADFASEGQTMEQERGADLLDGAPGAADETPAWVPPSDERPLGPGSVDLQEERDEPPAAGLVMDSNAATADDAGPITFLDDDDALPRNPPAHDNSGENPAAANAAGEDAGSAEVEAFAETGQTAASLVVESSGERVLENAIEAETMPVEAMPVEAMPVEAMPNEAMPNEVMPVEAMPNEVVPVEAMLNEVIPVEAVSTEATRATTTEALAINDEFTGSMAVEEETTVLEERTILIADLSGAQAALTVADPKGSADPGHADFQDSQGAAIIMEEDTGDIGYDAPRDPSQELVDDDEMDGDGNHKSSLDDEESNAQEEGTSRRPRRKSAIATMERLSVTQKTPQPQSSQNRKRRRSESDVAAGRKEKTVSDYEEEFASFGSFVSIPWNLEGGTTAFFSFADIEPLLLLFAWKNNCSQDTKTTLHNRVVVAILPNPNQSTLPYWLAIAEFKRNKNKHGVYRWLGQDKDTGRYYALNGANGKPWEDHLGRVKLVASGIKFNREGFMTDGWTEEKLTELSGRIRADKKRRLA
jgi:hypothetical protein